MKKSKVVDILIEQLRNEGGLEQIMLCEDGYKVILRGDNAPQGRRLVRILNALSLPARRPHKFKKRRKANE